jgi:hypothetical protein
VKILKNISILFFAVIFLISSTGIVIFQSFCECTGNEYVSIYVQPETCDQDFHQHHFHSIAGNEIYTSLDKCHECAAQSHDCGCDAPEVKYIKLINQLTDDEVKYVKVQNHDIFIAEINDELVFRCSSENNSAFELYTEPPLDVKTSLEFLIRINQLKIPNIA